MPRNIYISHGTREEKRLQEDLLIESLKIYGVETFYIPRKIVTRDLILNEVFESNFDSAFRVEMYFASIDSYEGDGALLSKFGLEVKSQMKLVMARRRWDELVGRFNVGHSVRPAEGDLIYVPMVKGLFEIKFVEGELPFYQLQNLPQWQMTCEQFDYDNQLINTGIEDIDQIERDYASKRVILTDASDVDDLGFSIGETITQTLSGGAVVTGEISEIENESSGVRLVLVGTNTTGESDWALSDSQNSNVFSIVDSQDSQGGHAIISITDEIQSTTEHTEFAQNDYFESQANDILDFSFDNPFGEANWVQ